MHRPKSNLLQQYSSSRRAEVRMYPVTRRFVHVAIISTVGNIYDRSIRSCHKLNYCLGTTTDTYDSCRDEKA